MSLKFTCFVTGNWNIAALHSLTLHPAEWLLISERFLSICPHNIHCANGPSSVHWQIVLVIHSLSLSEVEWNTNRTMASRREYIALFGSLILIFLEAFVRVITLGLRMFLTLLTVS